MPPKHELEGGNQQPNNDTLPEAVVNDEIKEVNCAEGEPRVSEASVQLRDIDGQIAEEILGWRKMEIAPDINGENGGYVLFPDRAYDPAKDADIPNVGPIHPAFFCPRYTMNMDMVIDIAEQVGLPFPFTSWMDMKQIGPQHIATMCLEHYRKTKA